MRSIELLAPAANADIAREAILHGADAVYMGGPSHGARKKAANSLEDIRATVEFAHRYRAKVYVTVNTLVYEHELADVERLIHDLYHAGVDALIVQDMSILRMNIPPIALHASTQCDTRSPAKAQFLQEVGFSQIVLARELTLKEIRAIADTVTVPIEAFVHGALCVSYSGRCHASQATCGRSANRGECAQICRLPYTLTDAQGKVMARDRHLLSLKDFNASSMLDEMLEAGVSSFKIEGRLKDADYVKNVTAYYRRAIDDIIAKNPEKYCRSSHGESIVAFKPNLSKSFNRGFTTYFLETRRPGAISQPLTPKSMGEQIENINQLHAGDGISWVDKDGKFTGAMVNGVAYGKIKANRPITLPKGVKLYRTFDNEWQQALKKNTAERRINVDVRLNLNSIEATDERGVKVILPASFSLDKAKKPMDFRHTFDRFGGTIYRLRNWECTLPEDAFVPASQLSTLRRRLIDALDSANRATYPFDYRRKENKDFAYPDKELTFADNVANSIARQFYLSHGVEKMDKAMEIWSKKEMTQHKADAKNALRVMTTRHCILREMGMCLKTKNAISASRLPLRLKSGPQSFQLAFDCDSCEMHVLSDTSGSGCAK